MRRRAVRKVGKAGARGPLGPWDGEGQSLVPEGMSDSPGEGHLEAEIEEAAPVRSRKRRYIRGSLYLGAVLLCLVAAGWVLTGWIWPSSPPRSLTRAIGAVFGQKDPEELQRLTNAVAMLAGDLPDEMREPIFAFLKEALGHEDPRMRALALSGLKDFLGSGHEEVMMLACEAFLDREAVVREAARGVLQGLPGAPDALVETLFREARSTVPGKRSRALAALAWAVPSSDPRFQKTFEEAANGSDARERETAEHILGGMEKGKVGLAAVTLCAPPDDRAHTGLLAARVLGIGNLASEGIVPRLAAWLPNETADGSQFAIAAVLGQMGPRAKEALPALLALAQARGSRCYSACLDAMVRISPENEEVRFVVARALACRDPRVSFAASKAVLALGNDGPLVGSYLTVALSSTRPQALDAALDILEKYPSAVGSIEKQLIGVLENRRSEPCISLRIRSAYLLERDLSNNPDRAQALMDSILYDPEASVRAACIKILQKLPRQPFVIDGLLEAFNNKRAKAEVRHAALYALLQLDPQEPRVLEAVSEGLADPNPKIVRCALTRARYLNPHDEAVRARLSTLFNHPDKMIRCLARIATKEIWQTAKPPAPPRTFNAPASPQERDAQIALLDSYNERDRSHARYYLSKREDSGTIEALLKLLDGSNEELERDAISILGGMRNHAKTVAPALIAHLEDERPRIRSKAQRSLQRLGGLGADIIPEVAAALGSAPPTTRKALIEVLVTIRHRSAEIFPELLYALERDPGTSRNIQRAIEEVAHALGIGSHRASGEAIRAHITVLSASLRQLRANPDAEERTIAALQRALRQLQAELARRSPCPGLTYILIRAGEFSGLRALLIALALWAIAAIALLILLLMVPRALLALDQRLARLDMRLMGRRFGVRHMLLLPALSRSTRALDAWVEGHIGSVRRALEEKGLLHAHQICIVARVAVDGGKPSMLRPESVALPFCVERPACLVFQGEPGIGKTHLACQIVRWAVGDDLSCRLVPHRVLPVFIDGSDEALKNKDAFIGEASRILEETAHPAKPISSGFFMRLVEKKRIVIIIDDLAESNHCHVNTLLSSQKEGIREGVWILTSRAEAPRGDITCLTVEPQRLQPAEVKPFIAAYLDRRGFEAPPDNSWRREIDAQEEPIPDDGLRIRDAVARAERLLAAAGSSPTSGE